MRNGPKLFALALVLSCLASAAADDLPTTCAYFPIEYDAESDELLFLVDEFYPAGGPINCNDPWGNLAWYSGSFSAWPEYCPDCAGPLAPYYASNQDRGLKTAISPCASLCSLIPDRIPAKNGACVCPRQAVTPLATHDIQVAAPGGGSMISVRLFEATVCPARAGLRPGPARTIRIGFETNRVPVANCRPFSTQAVKGRSYIVRVDYHGQRIPILTKTRMATDSLAAATTSPSLAAD